METHNPLSVGNPIRHPPYRPRRLPSPGRQNSSKQNSDRGRHDGMVASIAKVLCVLHPPVLQGSRVNCEAGDVQRQEVNWS